MCARHMLSTEHTPARGGVWRASRNGSSCEEMGMWAQHSHSVEEEDRNRVGGVLCSLREALADSLPWGCEPAQSGSTSLGFPVA